MPQPSLRMSGALSAPEPLGLLMSDTLGSAEMRAQPPPPEWFLMLEEFLRRHGTRGPVVREPVQMGPGVVQPGMTGVRG